MSTTAGFERKYTNSFTDECVLKSCISFACTVVNVIMVDNFAFLFNCMTVGRNSD